MNSKQIIITLLRWTAVVALMLTLALLCSALLAADARTCAAYWKSDLNASQSVRFLTLEGVKPAQREKWLQAMQFAIPSASRNANLDHQLPQPVPGSVASYWIDLDRLDWAIADFDKVLEKYPYATWSKSILFVRGDWLVYELADTRVSDAYYRLLYGGAKIPKNEKDFWDFWGVDEKNQGANNFGWIEKSSQVNKAGERFIERFVARGLAQDVWRTKDAKKITSETDPLVKLDGSNKHDGREYIAQFPKFSIKADVRAVAQAYLLTDGAGKVVQEAPVDLVEDYKRTFGQAAIINNAGCVLCHERGMNLPSVNGLKALLSAGVELKTYKQIDQEKIELFHLMDVLTTLNRNNEDYQKFVKACNGLSGPDNAKVYGDVLLAYGAGVTLADAARELSVGYEPVSSEDLKLALAYASANNIDIGNRLAALAHGIAMPRDQWEEDFDEAAAIVKTWQAGKIAELQKMEAAKAADAERVAKLETWVVFECSPSVKLFNKGKELKGRKIRLKFAPGQREHFDVRAVTTIDGQEVSKDLAFDVAHGETKEVRIVF